MGLGEEPHPDLGLRRGVVEVQPYRPSWGESFRRERELLAETMGPMCPAVEHIGSTAVPGLSAKPLIDIQVAMREIPVVDAPVVLALRRMGYRVMPERAFATRFFLPKGPEERRTHHLNLVVTGSEACSDPYAFGTHCESTRSYATTTPC